MFRSQVKSTFSFVPSLINATKWNTTIPCCSVLFWVLIPTSKVDVHTTTTYVVLVVHLLRLGWSVFRPLLPELLLCLLAGRLTGQSCSGLRTLASWKRFQKLVLCRRILMGNSIIPPLPGSFKSTRSHYNSTPLFRPLLRTKQHYSSFRYSVVGLWNSIPEEVVSFAHSTLAFECSFNSFVQTKFRAFHEPISVCLSSF